MHTDNVVQLHMSFILCTYMFRSLPWLSSSSFVRETQEEQWKLRKTHKKILQDFVRWFGCFRLRGLLLFSVMCIYLWFSPVSYYHTDVPFASVRKWRCSLQQVFRCQATTELKVQQAFIPLACDLFYILYSRLGCIKLNFVFLSSACSCMGALGFTSWNPSNGLPGCVQRSGIRN
jgi:hypothetical protein